MILWSQSWVMFHTCCNIRATIIAFEYPDLIILLLAKIVPSVLYVMVQFGGLAHVMRKDEAGSNPITMEVKSPGITEGERVVVDGTGEWPPYAVKISFGMHFITKDMRSGYLIIWTLLLRRCSEFARVRRTLSLAASGVWSVTILQINRCSTKTRTTEYGKDARWHHLIIPTYMSRHKRYSFPRGAAYRTLRPPKSRLCKQQLDLQEKSRMKAVLYRVLPDNDLACAQDVFQQRFHFSVIFRSHDRVVLEFLFIQGSAVAKHLESMNVEIQFVHAGADILDNDLVLLVTCIGLGDFVNGIVDVVWGASWLGICTLPLQVG